MTQGIWYGRQRSAGGCERRVHVAIQAYWQNACHPMFVAFLELSASARTDPELEAVLKLAQAAFHEEWYNTAIELFPEWRGDTVAFNLALDL